jgi:hypothetical protein
MLETECEVLNAYEQDQVEAIRKWKQTEPTLFNKAFTATSEPLAKVIHFVLPESAIKRVLAYGNHAARFFADKEDIKREGNVDTLSDFKHESLETCDRIANNVHKWSMGLAAIGGAGTGVFGVAGIAADIPILLTLSLRTIHKIGYCYGYEVEDEINHNFYLGILSVAGANSVTEKASGLYLLRNIELQLAKKSWVRIAERAASEQVIRETGLLVLKNLGKQVGLNLTKRKLLGAVPLVGAAVGGSVNALYLREVGWAARRAFQERWLIDNHKLTEI